MTDESIVRVLAGVATPAEVEASERWRLEARANEAYFQEISRAWTATAPRRPNGTVSRERVLRILEEIARRTSGLDVFPPR